MIINFYEIQPDRYDNLKSTIINQQSTINNSVLQFLSVFPVFNVYWILS
jgi:hypothetical protein